MGCSDIFICISLVRILINIPTIKTSDAIFNYRKGLFGKSFLFIVLFLVQLLIIIIIIEKT